MAAITHAEEKIYALVLSGELEIDAQGRIWRLKKRGGNRWTNETLAYKCKRVRAENGCGEYLLIRALIDGKRHCTQAGRLVWFHLYGSIPGVLTINHKNGNKKDNRPKNLELATTAEQALHSLHVLGHGNRRFLDQSGTRNLNAKLTNRRVRAIRRLRSTGMPLKKIASKFGVSFQLISRVCKGKGWAHVDFC